ncbi:hypothetical protein GOP47_0015205 [Adiantum capillus-veneris]|uniref:Uncharacterized protein n=1 Tax=Adiantum capillus-veneris TaxID=13818 RepID=A0A9D4UNF9_ADICA|nr:hypothetical protein GOP47_0015205 [Adiantum capillus-veneris]
MAAQQQQQLIDDASTQLVGADHHHDYDDSEIRREQETVLLVEDAGNDYHNMTIPGTPCTFATPKSTKRHHPHPPPAPRKHRRCRQSTSISKLGAHSMFFIPSDLQTLPDCIRTLFTQ